MLIISEFSDEEHAFMEVDEGSTDKSFGLRDFEGNGKESLVDLRVFVVSFLISVHFL